MLQSRHHHRLLATNFPFSPPTILRFHHPNLHFPHKSLPNGTLSASSLPTRTPGRWLAEASEPATVEDPNPASSSSEGPIELPPSSSIFAASDDPTTLQVATSVLLTGAISIFLFRSIRRRAKRAKELRFRSSGAKATLKDEALDRLNLMNKASIEAKAPPSPVQALLGGITAGVIALILYKFTTTIEAALNRQPISDNFSVRQIAITIRTIVNGLCYLATFVFGINSIGLLLYAGQLAFSSTMEASSFEQSEGGEMDQLNSADGAELSGTEGGEDPDSSQ